MSVFIDVAAVKVKDKNGNYSVPLNAVATPSVPPGSISEIYMQPDYAKQIENTYVTPEMFYFEDLHDGDWSYAIQAALDSGGNVRLAAKEYTIKHPISMDTKSSLEGGGWKSVIVCDEGYHAEENGGYAITIIPKINADGEYKTSNGSFLSHLRINCGGVASGICDGGIDFNLGSTTRAPIHDIFIDKCVNGLLTTSMGTVIHDVVILKNGAPHRQGIGIHFCGTDTIANNIKVGGFDVGVKISHGSNRVTNIKSSLNNVGIMLDDVNGCTVHGNTDENYRQGVIIDKAGRCNIAVSAVTSSNTSGGAERVPGMEVTRSFGNTIDFAYKLGNSISFAGNESCAIQITDCANNDITCHVTHKTGTRIPAVITDFAQFNNIMVNGFRHMRNSVPGELVEWEWSLNNAASAIDQSNKNELIITIDKDGVACDTKPLDFSGIWHMVACTIGTADFYTGAFTLSLDGVSGTTSLSNYVQYRDADNNYVHYELDWDSIKQALSAPVKKMNMHLQNSGAEGDARDVRVRVYAYKA